MLVERRRPDRRRHRREVAGDERVAVALVVEIVAQRPARRRRRRRARRRLAVEAQDVAQKAVVAGRHQVARLREEAAEPAAAVLEARAGQLTENDMSDRASRRRAPRTAAPGSDRSARCGRGSRCRARSGPGAVDDDGVGVAAEARARSKSETRCRRLSRYAAASPEIPAPITATCFHAARCPCPTTNGRRSRAMPSAASRRKPT